MAIISKGYNVVDKGDRKDPAILLLHGIGSDYRMWHLQIDVFVDKGYFVIAPDLLGHGKSKPVRNITLEAWNNQIVDILDYYGVDDVILVGVSMGGVIAQNFAIKYESRIDRLILVDTFCELKSLREKILGVSQVLGFKVFRLLGEKVLLKGMEHTYKADFAYHAKEYFTSSDRILNFQQLILARQAINKADFKGKLRKLNIPSLVMVGNEFGEGFVNINKKIADNIPNSKFLVLSEAMDPSCLTNPTRFNKEVLSFLNT